MDIEILSFNGLELNNTNYKARAPQGTIEVQANGTPFLVERTGGSPVFAYKGHNAQSIPVYIEMLGDASKQIDELNQTFNTFDNELRDLVIRDTSQWGKRWKISATAISVPRREGNLIVFNLLAPDPVFETVNQANNSQSLTSTGATWSVSNLGNADAYPVFEITPTSAKSGGTVRYRRFATIYNQTSSYFKRYPVEITDGGINTSTLVSGSKMESDGSDIHVLVDGQDADYWLDGINTSSTKIWVNLDLQPAISLTLDGAMGTGTITEIAVQNTSGNQAAFTNLPSSGLVQIDSELFYYTGKSFPNLTGVARAVRNTTAASHSDAATINWVEHDIWLVYGDSSLTDYTVEDTYKPILNLNTSTNTSFDYDDFLQFDDDENQVALSAQWVKSSEITGDADDNGVLYEFYTSLSSGFPPSYNDPYGRTWPVVGWSKDASLTDFAADLYLYSPVGITHVAADGYQYGETSAIVSNWDYNLQCQKNSSGTWADVFSIASAPSTHAVAESWSQSSTSLSGTFNGIRFYVADVPYRAWLDIDNVTLTLDSNNAPSVSLSGEQSSLYLINSTITNNTTGESISLLYPVPEDDTLIINTSASTVAHDDENTPAREALTVSTPRNKWLRLTPGGNELQYDETGLQGVTVVTKWRDRNK